MKKEDFAENKEYIALVVYKNNAKRIFYPSIVENFSQVSRNFSQLLKFQLLDEPPPIKDGVRINSPHYLVKLIDEVNDVNSSSSLAYTLVLAQYEKSNTIYYTIRAYSTCQFDFYQLKQKYNNAYNKTVCLNFLI